MQREEDGEVEDGYGTHMLFAESHAFGVNPAVAQPVAGLVGVGGVVGRGDPVALEHEPAGVGAAHAERVAAGQ